MKALVARGYGGVELLELTDVPVLVPGPGQIQVRIAAAGLNPADLRLVSGVFREAAPLTFPHVLRGDFAGTVTRTGEGVERFAPGDEIFGFGLVRSAGSMASVAAMPPSFTTGTMAEYALFEADTPALAHLPAGLAAGQAAALPTAALTALPLLRAWDFTAGTKVLVIGAAGGVGGAVVPLLAARGVHVIATAIPADEGYVRGLGAAEVIDYRSVEVTDETLRRHPEGVDALVNLALPGTSLPAAARAVRPGGRLLNIAFPGPGPDSGFETVYTKARPGDLEEVGALAVKGVLPDTVTRRYDLDEGVRAYTDLAHEHVRGKLLVTVSAG
ncbi:NADP-dependent oxidoreductase [Nonomuraea zeae]|uniref:NADP-dependent oxidoreductase n=1 Tax=Nonomuraea zeae TaxID=1642303 RepID=A0A5S4G6T6_9ACTN|nr:NADP-dependent oxidoreductase [Nonomuraea zeae]TMR28735.1 NADP-dependent oxidoreductase [Nonomuraea zeae]